ncbi:hypothetical protein T05_1659 [Trichinella murrelli]|uniref:Uncharacterized protein n=1 Tax=Trichinella murrelli TaxID=144512 RepID=A0A0V0TYR3_9BILA|nr:hypothetical protein T05_1659 [Trichinella murrelli]
MSRLWIMSNLLAQGKLLWTEQTDLLGRGRIVKPKLPPSPSAFPHWRHEDELRHDQASRQTKKKKELSSRFLVSGQSVSRSVSWWSAAVDRPVDRENGSVRVAARWTLHNAELRLTGGVQLRAAIYVVVDVDQPTD